MQILTVVGSLRRRSANRSLLELISGEPFEGVTFVPALSLGKIPHYDSDIENPPPAAVVTWRAQLAAADAVVIASPEYGHGVSGVLKNALDWTVRSGEFNEKPVAATCAAQGKGRGLLGTAALVQTLRAIDARVVWSSPIEVPRSSIDPDGKIDDEETQRFARELLETLLRSRG